MQPDSYAFSLLCSALVCLFPLTRAQQDTVKRTLTALQRVVGACGYVWDGVCLAVAMPQSLRPHLEMDTADWEDVCRAHGFEYVDYEVKGRNEYGGLLVFLWREGSGALMRRWCV